MASMVNYKSRQGLSRESIKLLAILLMTLNHFAYIFLPPDKPLTCLFTYAGYFTMVTMCAFLVEGFSYTRSRKRYALRLAVFSIISQLPFRMMHDYPFYSRLEGFNGLQQLKEFYFADPSVFARRVVLTQWNAIFSLLICFILLYILENRYRLRWWIPAAAGLLLLSLCGDWPGFAFGFTVFFYLVFRRGITEEEYVEEYKSDELKRAYLIIALVVGITEFAGLPEVGVSWTVALLRGIEAAGGIFLSMLVMTIGYKGRTTAGKSRAAAFLAKWFFYFYYPIHMLVLVLAALRLPGR